MPVKKPALGRGLDALFVSNQSDSSLPTSAGTRILNLAIGSIRPNPFQPRKNFDEKKLDELAASIKQMGILQPILVRKKGDGFEIVTGERRWRAARMAGLSEIPAQAKRYDDHEMMEAALIENIQRDDLDPIEEARGYELLISNFGLTQESLAETVGKSRVAITNALRLLRLPKEVLDLIRAGQITAGHARALLSLPSSTRQIALAHEIIKRGLNVRGAEQLVRRKSAAQASQTGKAHLRDEQLVSIAHRLTETLGMKVNLTAKTNTSGRLEISYSTLDEFATICERLGLTSNQSV